MEKHGQNPGLPHTRSMGDGLFEIRAKGAEGIGRAMFCAVKGKRIVILHGFIKQTQRTSPADLKVVRTRLKKVVNESAPHDDGYVPVKFNPKDYAAKRSRKDAEFTDAYAQLQDEFAALDVLLNARKATGLTQAEVAERMGVKPSALTRIEMSLVNRKLAIS